MFRKWLLVGAACMVLGAGAIAAQDGTAPPDLTAPAAYADVRLSPNPALDPFLVTIIATGQTPASSLGDCTGYVPLTPSATLTVDGDQAALNIFFKSESDAVLAVIGPDGYARCNDDASNETLDPFVSFDGAMAGTYVVFVGTFTQGDRIPGFLVFSSTADLSPMTLSIASLVANPPQLDAEPALEAFDLTQLNLSADGAQTLVEVPANFDLAEVTLTGGGGIPALSLDTRGSICTGYINAQPSAFVQVTGAVPAVRVLFESPVDSTLLIVRISDGAYACADDMGGGLNPVLDVFDVEPGDYAVFIGGFDPAQSISGTLTLTTDLNAMPEMLEPAESAAPAGQ
jgi:hypothetical protein